MIVALILKWGLPALLGVAGGVGGIFLSSMTAFGQRWVVHAFDRELESFKHTQGKELENLRAQLARLGDRSVRTNEREYAALITAWEQFVDAYRATTQCVVRFMSYPDFKQMSDEKTRQYLSTTELSEIQRDQVVEASPERRGDIFARIMRMRLINKAAMANYEARSTLEKQSIFVPSDIEERLEAAIQMLSETQVAESMDFDHGYTPGVYDKRGNLFKEGKSVFVDIKGMVRARIGAVNP